MSSVLLQVFSTLSGLYAKWTLFCFGAFMSNVKLWVPYTEWLAYAVPYSIDEPNMKSDSLVALLKNLLLLSAFVIQHSVMLRKWYKQMLRGWIPEVVLAPLYTFFSGVFLHIILALWTPVGPCIWRIESSNPLFSILHILRVLGFVTALASVQSLPIEAIQLTQAKKGNLQASETKQLRMQFPYNVVRHPAMTGMLLATWSTPWMSVGHLFLSVFFTLYIVGGVLYLEEPDLVKDFGEQYIKYQKRVPAFLPIRGVVHKLD